MIDNNEAFENEDDGSYEYMFQREKYEKNGWGDGLLFYALRAGNLNRVKELVAQGADVNVYNNGEETVMIDAAISGSLELVQWFVSQGADVNAKNNNGKTVLCYAYDSANWEQLTQ